jgi:hypothetical protein
MGLLETQFSLYRLLATLLYTFLLTLKSNADETAIRHEDTSNIMAFSVEILNVLKHPDLSHIQAYTSEAFSF